MNYRCPKCATIVSAQASGGDGKILCPQCNESFNLLTAFVVELERLLEEHRKAKEALASAIVRGIETVDDSRAGAYEVPTQVYTEFERNVDQIETEIRDWAVLDDNSKRSLRKRIDGLRNSLALRRTKNRRRLSAIEELLKGLRRIDLPRYLEALNEQVQDLEAYPLERRRNLLKESKSLRSENRPLMEREQLRQISEMITRIRKATGRKWWEFWL